jgi:hypothetical protein
MTRPYHLSEIAENLRRGDGMPEIDQLLRALFLVALLLYLIPAVFRLGSSAEARRWFQRGAILTLGTAIAIAVIASVIWFAR